MRKWLLCLGLLAGGCEDVASPLADLPPGETVRGGVDRPVQVIRDEHGVPHLYGGSVPDVAYAQGYVTAQDRWVQMDLARHLGAGTLAELYGALDESFVDRDIQMRAHHLRATAEQVYAALQASTDPEDGRLVLALLAYAAGANAALREIQAGDRKLPPALALAYDPGPAAEWTPVDSLLLARLQAFDLSFDADTEIARSAAEAAAFRTFDQSGDAGLRSRRGLAGELFRTAPLEPAFVLPDAEGCGQSGKAGGRDASATSRARRPAPGRASEPQLLDLLRGLQLRERPEALGSNNWVVGPRHTGGRPLLANDTHLDLSNPPIFYLVHLNVAGEPPVMGVQFPGLPGVVLGMNDRLAWGSTVNDADVTDVYEERILRCEGGAPCVEWRDPKTPGAPAQRVLLTPRKETIRVGRFGRFIAGNERQVTLWDVPHHGPLRPRVVDHQAAAPGAVELSVRYTGYEPTFEIRALLRLARARSVAEGMAVLEADFRVGSENWVLADADGHIGYTSAVAMPRRPAGAQPWLIQPGDGSAEWDGEVPAAEQPRAYDPACGMIVTANNDPVGATAGSGGQPGPYLGWDYDVGARAGRITARLRDDALTPERLTPARMQGIQGDHRSFLGGLLAPVLRAAAADLLTEMQTPGGFPDLSALAREVDEAGRRRLVDAQGRLAAWKLGTPSGLDNEADPEDLTESVATTIFNLWLLHFHARTLGDEFAAIDEAYAAQGVRPPRPGSAYQRKLLIAAALHPDTLALGRGPGGDSILFDDLGTKDRTETRREIAARSLVAALTLLAGTLGEDPGQWRWGRLHRLTLAPLVPVADLQLPDPRDPAYPTGVPRHGDLYAVDTGSFGLRYGALRPLTDFTFAFGAAIRFVAEVGPDGPRAWNALPGGERFDPESPHYADQFALWRKNEAFALPFRDEEVAASARREADAGGIARTDILPASAP